MDSLKKIPIKYLGELHDIRLINFSVDLDEVMRKVPDQMRVRDFNGRALISMVDVRLKNMHPSFAPFLDFNYRHIAFRLLLEDAQYNAGINKGIFFLRSFTDKKLIVMGGSLLTSYNLEMAVISEKGNEVQLSQDEHHIKYSIGDQVIAPLKTVQELQTTVGAIDRAYSFVEHQLRVTQIQREKWPIQPVACYDFKTTFFETARLEGAFRVFEVINYQWLPSKKVLL